MGKLARQFKARAGKAQKRVQAVYNRAQTANRMKKFGNLIGGLAQNKIKLDQVEQMRGVLKRQAISASEKLNRDDLDPMERFMYEQQLQNVDLLNSNLNINTIGSFFSDALAVNKALDPSGLIQAQMNLEATNRWRELTLEMRRQNIEGQNRFRNAQIDRLNEEARAKELENLANQKIIGEVLSGSFSLTPSQSNPVNPANASRFLGIPSFLKGIADSRS